MSNKTSADLGYALWELRQFIQRYKAVKTEHYYINQLLDDTVCQIEDWLTTPIANKPEDGCSIDRLISGINSCKDKFKKDMFD